jgi:REP element-mobilizing transposase RayT
MPREQREKGEFSTYHIIQRGNERKSIFLQDGDKERFLETVTKAKDKYNFLIYCYCLMDNHVHILINDNGNDISKIMKSINVSYVSYFNRIYHRYGHLFQDRFKSELICNDQYLLEVSRYIHNNPVKAGIADKPGDYRWSSYNVYVGKLVNRNELLDTGKILAFFSDQKRKAVAEYICFVDNNSEEPETILEIEEERQNIGQENHHYINGRVEARQAIERILGAQNRGMDELLQNKKQRDELIKEIRKNSSLSLKELGELFGGLSESRISRIVRD